MCLSSLCTTRSKRLYKFRVTNEKVPPDPLEASRRKYHWYFFAETKSLSVCLRCVGPLPSSSGHSPRNWDRGCTAASSSPFFLSGKPFKIDALLEVSFNQIQSHISQKVIKNEDREKTRNPRFFIPFKIALNLGPLDTKIGQLFKLPTPFGRSPENEGYWIEILKKENR